MPRLRLLAELSGLALLALAAPATAQVQHLHYRFGPIHVSPGQNTNLYAPTDLRPDVPGWITKFRPNLEDEQGAVQAVEVVHLHHGGWVVGNEPRFAVG